MSTTQQAPPGPPTSQTPAEVRLEWHPHQSHPIILKLIHNSHFCFTLIVFQSVICYQI